MPACGSSEPEPPKYPPIDFSGELPLTFDAGHIEIKTVNSTNRSDSDFPIPPLEAMQSWARLRLHAKGSSNLLRFVIYRASGAKSEIRYDAQGNPVAKSKKADEYEVRLEGTLEIVRPDGGVTHATSTSVSDARIVRPDASSDDREQACYQLTKDAMGKFDREMEAQIRDVFGTDLLSR